MPSKYDEVLKSLGQAPHEKGREYQVKIDGVKSLLLTTAKEIVPSVSEHSVQLRTVNAASMADEYQRLRAHKDVLESALEETNLRLEALLQMMVKQYEGERLESVRLAGVGSVAVGREPVAQVWDQREYLEWVKRTPYRQKLALPWQTTNMIMKERLLEGLEPPDGVRAFWRPKVRLTRDK